MKFKSAERIREMPLQDWDAIAGEHFALTSAWQRVMEDCANNYHPRYLLLEDDAGPAALCIAPRWDMGPRWEQFLMRRFLQVFAPYSAAVSGIVTRPDIQLRDVIDPLHKALAGMCRRNFQWFLSMTVPASEDAAVLRMHGYQTMPVLPTTVMEIRWPTFAEYQASLLPKDRREHFRNLRNLEKAGLELCFGPTAESTDELYALYLKTAEHHGLSRHEAAPFGRRLFDAMATHLGDNVRIFRCKRRKDGRTILFLLGATNQSECVLPIAGLDYQYGSLAGFYRVLHTEAISWAIDLGARHVHGGTTTYRLKQRLGYQIVPRWLCYRANSVFLRPLVAGLSPWVEARFGYREEAAATDHRP